MHTEAKRQQKFLIVSPRSVRHFFAYTPVCAMKMVPSVSTVYCVDSEGLAALIECAARFADGGPIIHDRDVRLPDVSASKWRPCTSHLEWFDRSSQLCRITQTYKVCLCWTIVVPVEQSPHLFLRFRSFPGHNGMMKGIGLGTWHGRKKGHSTLMLNDIARIQKPLRSLIFKLEFGRCYPYDQMITHAIQLFCGSPIETRELPRAIRVIWRRSRGF